MDALHCSFDVIVRVFVNSLARFELCCIMACRLEAEVLEDLGRREVPVHLAKANAFRSPLLLFILLDLVEELPQVAWVVGGKARIVLRPHPGSRHYSFPLVLLPSQCTGKYPSQGTPLGSSWNLVFLNLTWHGPFLSRIPAGIPGS